MANVSQERSRSIWMQLGPDILAAALRSDVTCDVVVVGAGIRKLMKSLEIQGSLSERTLDQGSASSAI